MNREIYLLETNQSEVKIFWMKKRLCDLWIKKDGVIATLFKTAVKRALLNVEGNSDLQVGKTDGKVICQILSTSSDFIQALLFDEEARPIGAWERPGLLSPVAQGRRQKRCGFNPWIVKICWRRARQPSPGFLPGEFPWTEELGGPLSMGSPRVRHDWSNLACTHACGTRRHEMFWDGMDDCSWISFPWASWCCFDISQRQGWKWSSQPHYHTHLHTVTKVV